MKDGPQISGPYINISSGTTEIENPEDTPTNIPYSDIQNVKAKYGSDAGIYRNTGNGTPINTSETSNVQKSMAQNMVSIQSSQLKLEKQIHSMLE